MKFPIMLFAAPHSFPVAEASPNYVLVSYITVDHPPLSPIISHWRPQLKWSPMGWTLIFLYSGFSHVLPRGAYSSVSSSLVRFISYAS